MAALTGVAKSQFLDHVTKTRTIVNEFLRYYYSFQAANKEWAAQGWGSLSDGDWDTSLASSSLEGIAKADYTALFTTCGAIDTLMGTGHLTNLTKLGSGVK